MVSIVEIGGNGVESVLRVFSEFQEGKGIRQGGSRGGEELDSSIGLAGFFSLAPPLVAKDRCPHLKIGVTTYSLSESVVKVNGS